MDFVIPSRDPATTPKTKYDYEIRNSSCRLVWLGRKFFVAAPLRMGNNIIEAGRTSHCDRLWSYSRQSLYFRSGHIRSDYAWIFLILKCISIKFWWAIEVFLALDGFMNFWWTFSQNGKRKWVASFDTIISRTLHKFWIKKETEMNCELRHDNFTNFSNFYCKSAWSVLRGFLFQ